MERSIAMATAWTAATQVRRQGGRVATEGEVNAKLEELARVLPYVNEPPIFALTVLDFYDALEMVTDTRATFPPAEYDAIRARILERVRKDVGWAERTEHFVEIVRDCLQRELSGEED
jgi:hypothetical protein